MKGLLLALEFQHCSISLYLDTQTHISIAICIEKYANVSERINLYVELNAALRTCNNAPLLYVQPRIH